VVGYGFLVELLLFRHSVKGPSFSQEKYGPGSPAFAPVTASLLYLRQLLALLCCEGQRFGSAGHGEAFGRLERTVCRHTGLTRNIYQEALKPMREVMKRQAELGELSIGAIALDRKSRDDIPKLLVGLQYIYTHRELRDEVFGILQEVIPQRVDGKNASSALGRPGMDQWKILVLGVVRLGLDADYDRLQELANQHGTLRQMLGHADWYDKQVYEVQTLKDNLRLFTREILGRINTAVVRAGHALLKKSGFSHL
jgi:hypothetical protein